MKTILNSEFSVSMILISYTKTFLSLSKEAYCYVMLGKYTSIKHSRFHFVLLKEIYLQLHAHGLQRPIAIKWAIFFLLRMRLVYLIKEGKERPHLLINSRRKFPEKQVIFFMLPQCVILIVDLRGDSLTLWTPAT